MSSYALGKKGNGCIANIFMMSLYTFLCKVEYESDKFIHAPTYTYNEVMRLLKLVGIIKCE